MATAPTGTGSSLPDGRARRRIAEDLTTLLAVDAAAGSGKTSSLVGRIVALVGSGEVPLRQIAAITFTEAAAAELRSRLRRALVAEGRGDAANDVYDVDDAAICTIHAFAHRLLAEHWLAAGLPPGFEVLDSAAEQIERRQRWDEFSAELLEDPGAHDVLMRALALGVRLHQLVEVGRCLGDQRERLTPEVLGALDTRRRAAAWTGLDLGPLVTALEEALAHRAGCTADDDRLLGHLQGPVAAARADLGRLDPAEGEGAALSVLADLPKLASNLGQSLNWPKVERVRQDCATAERVRLEILDRARQSVLSELVWRVAGWVVSSAERRRAEGTLSFQDLLIESCRLLREDTEVRAAAAERFRCLLIDEFQDTDPLQVELAELLTGLATQAMGSSPGRPTGPARLFVVGDPEQSIYRFRRADLELFGATVARLDDRLELTANFRSVPGILRWVDAVFEQIHGAPPTGEATRPAHRSLEAVRSALAGVDRPVVAYGEPRALPASEVRAVAATETAALVAGAVADGWPVEDLDTGAVRPARYGDVAILLPTRTGLATLEQALEQVGVPYRLEGAALMWSTEELGDLLAVLGAVDDPADPIAVVAALRTPALACGDDDLVRYHAAGGGWDPRADRPAGVGAEDPVAQALARLRSLHAQRMWREPSAMVATVMSELHCFELALLHRRPRDRWQRLRWALDQARLFDERQGGTLTDFLEWVALRRDADGGGATLGPPDPDDDAVRVLTVHGAKGLEFPVVVLTGLDTLDHRRAGPAVLWGEDGPEVSLPGGLRTPGYDDLLARERAAEDEERIRLLYVAATRPRDHLLVDLNHKDLSGRASGLVPELARSLARWPETWRRPDAEVGRMTGLVEPPAAGDGSVAQGPATDWWRAREDWLRRRSEIVRQGRRQPAWSATALAAAALAPQLPFPPSAIEHPGRDAETARRIGRAVHSVLATADLSALATDDPSAQVLAALDGLVARASAAQHLPAEEEAEVGALVRAALGTPSVRLLAGGRTWRELPLVAPADPGGGMGGAGVIEGVADLVGEVGGELVVVDFKTGAEAAGGNDPAASSRHLRQLACYAYALGQATGGEVARVVVAYLAPSGGHEVVLGGAALKAMVQDVVATAARLSAGTATAPTDTVGA